MITAYSNGVGSRAVAAYAGAAAVAADYLDARESGDRDALERLTAPIWNAKRASPSGGVAMLDRTALFDGPAVEAGGTQFLSSIALCGGDFAVVRADRSAPPATTLLFLFKVAGAWRVASETSADSSDGGDPRFTARDNEREVLDVLETYYRAVTDGDPTSSRRIFASCWHMKNHENGMLLAEGTDAFAARLDQPLPTYWKDRQIADVHIVANCLAYVRVDRPSTPGTTVFLLAREQDGWKVIDKAWTDGRDPPH